MSIDDLSDVIEDEAVSLTITRSSAPAMSNGRAGVVTTSSFTITACVQPAPTRELLLFPEGIRNRGMVKLFSAIELKDLPLPDQFDYLGAVWDVVKVDDWMDVGGYYRCFAARVSET